MGETLYEWKECTVEIPDLTKRSGYIPATGEHIFIDGKCTVCGKSKFEYDYFYIENIGNQVEIINWDAPTWSTA